MTDLTPITALGSTVARSEQLGELRVTKAPDFAFASLSLRAGQPVPSPFGLVLPGPGRAVQAEAYGAFWIGRDQWLIEAAGSLDLAALLKAAVPGASVAEQTDGFAAFDLVSDHGPAALEMVMGKLVNLDPSSFPPGSATRTTLEHIGVFLVRRAEDRLSVIGMRTYATALWHALTRAARRSGPSVPTSDLHGNPRS